MPLQLTKDIRKPVVLPQGSKVSLCVARGNAGLLSSYCRRTGPHFELMGEFRNVSLVAAGRFELLSSCDGDFSEPLMLPQEIQASFHVARGIQGSYQVTVEE